MNKVLILIGCSGSGKTTIANQLSRSKNFTKVPTDTTRKPRINEIDGIHYNFISYVEMVKRRLDYIEVFQYNKDCWYGTNAKRIDAAKEEGDAVICMEINGAKAVKQYYGEDAFIIFIDRNLESIKKALNERVDTKEITEEQLAERISLLHRDIKSKEDPTVDFIVLNESTIEAAVQQILDFVNSGYTDPYVNIISLTNTDGESIDFVVFDRIEYDCDLYYIVADTENFDDIEEPIELICLLVDCIDNNGAPAGFSPVIDERAEAVFNIFYNRHEKLNIDV